MNAFTICAACDGKGFVAYGVIPDRIYEKCAICKGLGQIYIEVQRELIRNKIKPMHDPVVF